MFFIIKIRYFLAVYKKIPYLCIERFAVVAQLVERKLPKLQVAGSCPVYRSLFLSHYSACLIQNLNPMVALMSWRDRLTGIGFISASVWLAEKA